MLQSMGSQRATEMAKGHAGFSQPRPVSVAGGPGQSPSISDQARLVGGMSSSTGPRFPGRLRSLSPDKTKALFPEGNPGTIL